MPQDSNVRSGAGVDSVKIPSHGQLCVGYVKCSEVSGQARPTLISVSAFPESLFHCL